MKKRFFCAACSVKNCEIQNNDPQKYPQTCPTKLEQLAAYRRLYDENEDFVLAQKSALCAPDHSEPRLMKTIRFAKECGFTKIGLAFCVALSKEAGLVDRILRENGLDVYSIVCKVGNEDRSFLGVGNSSKTMCNPIAQAKLLNEAGTQLNIVVGLCVGHDALFIKYSDALVTVLATKDHVYDHAPLRCLDVYANEQDEG